MPGKLEARVAQHDREIAAIRKLILTGMKMIVRRDQQLDRIAAEHEAMRREMRELAATLQRFIRSMETGHNGHSKRDVH